MAGRCLWITNPFCSLTIEQQQNMDVYLQQDSSGLYESYYCLKSNGNCLNDKWDDGKILKFMSDKQLLINEAYKGKVFFY